jgi:hypothetical protein
MNWFVGITYHWDEKGSCKATVTAYIERGLTLYRSLISNMGYVAVTVRFDVSHTLSVLSSYLSRPNARLIAAAKPIVKYLVHTAHQGLRNNLKHIGEGEGKWFRQCLFFSAVDASFGVS